MSIPQILYQTSPRWLVVYKPVGWSLSRRGNHASDSLEAYLSPILTTSSKLFFPFDMDTRMSGLGIVCCDRGMVSQFERLSDREEMFVRYRVMMSEREVQVPGNQRSNISKVSAIESGEWFDLKALKYLSMQRIRALLNSKEVPKTIQLYSVEFPEPLLLVSERLKISIPPLGTN
jgi:hypothetical protein